MVHRKEPNSEIKRSQDLTLRNFHKLALGQKVPSMDPSTFNIILL